MAGTGLLMAFKTARLVGIPIIKFGYPPSVSWLHLFPCNAMSAPHRCHHHFSSTDFPCPNDAAWTSRLLSWSSGFSPPHRYRVSRVLKSSVIFADLPPSDPITVSGSPYRSGFLTSFTAFEVRPVGLPWVRRTTFPISRPTSLRFGSPDIGPRSRTPARPPPRCHIVGSLFATYIGSASCFPPDGPLLEPPMPCWRCPSVR